MTAKEIRMQAVELVKGKYALAFGVTLVFYLIQAAVQSIPIIGWLGGIFLTGPFMLGLSQIFLKISRKNDPQFGELFAGFQQYGKALTLYLLILIYVFLWALLLIVPGIIAGYSYSMSYFLLVDHPELNAKQAIAKSKTMMDGHKMRLFVLCLSYVGWILLSCLTLGILFIWVLPRIQTAMAIFYEDLKKRVSGNLASQYIEPTKTE